LNKKPGKSRRYLRSRITRNLILETAQKVFLEKGYAKTTITKISEEAGVGYGTVYSHFKGKDDLLNNIIDHVMEGFLSLLGKNYNINDCGDLYNIFYRQINAVFGLAIEHRAILQVLREALGQSESIKEHWDSALYEFVAGASRIINIAHKKDLTRDVDTRITSKALIFMVESFFWDVVHEKETDLEMLSDTVTRLFLEGMVSKLGTEIKETPSSNKSGKP